MQAVVGEGNARTAATSARNGGSIAYWALVGALGAFGLAAALTIGSFFLAGATALAILGFALPAIDNRSTPAVLIGSAIAPLYIGWLNRQGPGEKCAQIAGGVTCVEQWSPWPLIAGGLLLVTVGVVLLGFVSRQPSTATRS